MKTLLPAVVCFLLFMVPVNFVASQNSNPDQSDTTQSVKKNYKTDDINVHAQMPVTSNVDGNLRFNVSSSTFNFGSNAFEIIQKFPFVFATDERNITVNNSSNILIHINGRVSNLYSTIRNIPADKIEYIELNLNPGVKYTSSDITAIINIVLKKDDDIVYNGYINANADTKEMYSSSFSFNTKIDKISVYGIYDLGRGRNSSDITRFRSPQVSNFSDYNTFSGSNYSKSKNYSLSLSGIYDFSDNTFLQVDYLDEKRSVNTDGTMNITGGSLFNPVLLKSDKSTSSLDMPADKMSAYFKHNFSKKTILEGEFNLTRTHDYLEFKNDNLYINTKKQNISYPDYKMTRNETSHIYSYSLDISHKQTEKLKYELGLKYILDEGGEYNFLDTSTLGYYISPQTREYSNQFDLNRNNFSLYTSINFSDLNYSLISAFKLEYSKDELTNIYWDDVTNNYIFDKISSEYTISPVGNLKFIKKLDQTSDVNLTISKKINRPTYNQLNQYKINADEYNIREGNISLKPENIYNAEIAFNKFNPDFSIRPAINFKYTTDMIRRVAYVFYNPETEVSSSYSTLVNAGERIQFGFDLYSSIRAIQNLFISGSVGVNHTDFKNIPDVFEGNKINLTGKLNVNYMITDDFSANAYFNYKGYGKTALSVSEPVYFSVIGLSHTFFDKALSVNLQGLDLFNTYNNSYNIYGENYTDEIQNNFKMQSVSLNISYTFGKTFEKKNKKPKKKDNEEESKTPDLH